MENKNIFWGVLLVVIGALFIFDNMDLINFSFSALVGLWPLLLVVWGISILPIKPVIKTVTALGIAALALIYASTSDDNFWWEDHVINNIKHGVHVDSDYNYDDEDDRDETYYTFQFDEKDDLNIEEAKLTMDVAAGKFRIDDVTTEHIIDFEAYSNLGPYTSNMVSNGNTADIQIGFDDAEIKGGSNKNRASVKLNPKVIWDMQINVGAADFRGDFKKFKIRSLDVDGGASAMKFYIGDLQDETDIKLDAGAASIKISIPEAAGCKVSSESFLVDMDLSGFHKNENGDYITPNFEESKQKVYIKINAAVSQLNVRRY